MGAVAVKRVAQGRRVPGVSPKVWFLPAGIAGGLFFLPIQQLIGERWVEGSAAEPTGSVDSRTFVAFCS
jgi:hypothetical protein